MNLQRRIGLALFWGGFLAASICMVQQREIDLLPASERDVLLNLPEKFSIPEAMAPALDDKLVRELPSTAFVEWVQALQAEWSTQKEIPSPPVASPEDVKAEDNVDNAQPTVARAQIAVAGQPSKPLTKEDLIKRRVASLGSLWKAVYWPGYLMSIAIGISGAILIRSSGRGATDTDLHRQAGLEQMFATLQTLNTQIDRLIEALPQLAPEETVTWIDTHCAPLCADFADNRELMKSAFGLNGFAAVMSDFASGERFLNRVWSAAADGYMEEAWRSLRTSQQFFHAAALQMQQRKELIT